VSADYGSHLPVLEAVVGLIKPRSVLELGGGLHSTPFFLSQPLERLVSVETDPKWRRRIADLGDSRLRVHTNLDYLKRDSLAGFDLIFIDDGTCAEDRESSIRWVLGQKRPPTIIHDAEVYDTVIDEFTSDYAVIPTNPDTAVVW
jgi:hypothetical protein